jgi:hypothetical protein
MFESGEGSVAKASERTDDMGVTNFGLFGYFRQPSISFFQFYEKRPLPVDDSTILKTNRVPL